MAWFEIRQLMLRQKQHRELMVYDLEITGESHVSWGEFILPVGSVLDVLAGEVEGTDMLSCEVAN